MLNFIVWYYIILRVYGIFIKIDYVFIKKISNFYKVDIVKIFFDYM